MDKANFLSRFFALVLDSIAMAFVSWLIILVWTLFAASAAQTDSGFLDVLQGVVGVAACLTILLLQFLYCGYFWSKNGQSLGMKLLNIKVVMRGGESISFARGGLRGSLGYWISGFFFSLGFIWAAFDADGEAWHDKLFDTRVVQA